MAFTLATFPGYQVNWHHRVLCETLDRFVAGEITRLMVFMPPRYGKSELVSRRLPAYILGRDPDAQVIATSYGADLAGRMNRDVQRIIDSSAYAEIFPKTRLSGSNVRFEAQGTFLRNSDIFEIVGRKGVYRSAGIGGGITGMGCNYGIIDDPIKSRAEANSSTYRNAIWEWYTSTFYTRLEKDARILITLTRWHQDDLAGRLLLQARDDPTADQWTVVKFPAIKEDDSNPDDPREIGEPLWPAKYSLERLMKTKTVVGLYDWHSLYQQQPRPPEGAMFQRGWFEVVDAAPADARWVRYWDLAATEPKAGRDPDWTAGCKMGEKDGVFYISDMRHLQASPMNVELEVKQAASLDGRYMEIHMEQEPGSSGVNTIDHYQRTVLKGFPFYGSKATGSKVERARPLSAAAQAGNVKLVRGPWISAFLDEVEMFPTGSYDDQVDAASGAMEKLANGMTVDADDLLYTGPEEEEEPH